MPWLCPFSVSTPSRASRYTTAAAPSSASAAEASTATGSSGLR